MEENKTTVHDLNKLEVKDVWKDFYCPKYVTHLCPKTDKLSKEILDFYEQLKLDTNHILQKLDKLISDPITSDSIVRICRLLYDYLDKVGDDGYVSFNKHNFGILTILLPMRGISLQILRKLKIYHW